ncbi:MAG TPA: serine hydrolase domain-containing protein [Acidimicrobiia bacterium]|nr:serine hydrolase domain-containing protein [Acidimicrobiia bacterium]
MKAIELIGRWPVPSPAMAVVGREGLRFKYGSFYTVFRWASVTKLFTAYSVLVGIIGGRWTLDDAAGPPGSTVRHLLAHASGLPFEGRTPITPPGRRRIYSNTGFDLLGEFVSEKTGRIFADYLQDSVLGPLGIEAELVGRPSEGLVGGVEGMARLAAELLTPTLLDPDLLEQATTVTFPSLPGMLPGVGRFDPLEWGLGFEIKGAKSPHWTGQTNSPETYGHFGGSGAFLWVDPVASIGLCVQTGREFGPWALESWPILSDAVLAEATG